MYLSICESTLLNIMQHLTSVIDGDFSLSKSTDTITHLGSHIRPGMIYEMYYQIFTAILNTLSSRGHSFSCIYYQFKIHFDSHTLVSCNRPNLVTKILKVFCVVLFSYILSMYWFLWPTFVRVLKILLVFF